MKSILLTSMLGTTILVALMVGDPSEGAANRAAPCITVFAAASLQDVVDEIADAFETKTGIAVTVDTGSSGVLAAKIRAGARGDVFLSASKGLVTDLRARGFLTDQPVVNVAANRLVCVVRQGTPSLQKPSDLRSARFDRIALGDPDHVPAGRRAREALESAGLWTALGERIAPCLDVRAALAHAQRGTAQAAIVYATDAALAKGLEVALRFPATAHGRILYPACVLRTGGARAAASRFVRFLRSPLGRAAFARHGFARLSDGEDA